MAGHKSKGIYSAEVCARMSKRLQGVAPHRSVIDAARKANIGRKHTEEAKRNMARSQRRKPDDFILTQETLKELFCYEPETGLFTRLKRTGSVGHPGLVTGTKQKFGHFILRIYGQKFLAHRLAWLYMTGQWPAGSIDHINGDGGDNRWANLREVSHAVNLQNQRRARSDNSTGYLGVSPRDGRYQAIIFYDGRNHRLGTFDTPEEAYAAYLKAKRKYHVGNTL